jgi:uncharacterized protein
MLNTNAYGKKSKIESKANIMKKCSTRFDPANLKLLATLRQSPGVHHPKFKDLLDPSAVVMDKRHVSAPQEYTEEHSTIIHLTITGRCYAKCRGCINSAVTFGEEQLINRMLAFQECIPERDASIILNLTRQTREKQVTIAFYGGEPFLEAGKMEKVRKILRESPSDKSFRFMVYTNGELIEQAIESYPELVQSMWLYSVSIDGDEQQHNAIRSGTQLKRIIQNLTALKPRRLGQVLFWSTLREEQSLWRCFEQFLKLYQDGLVDHFFWHWAETKDAFNDFPRYIDRYGLELEKVMDEYVKRLSAGRLLPIAHLNELILYLATGRQRGHSACAVELAQNYDILDGRVFPCADLPAPLDLGQEREEGALKESDLANLVQYKDWLGCAQCGVHPYCGGRCPVQALAGSPERTVQYCQLMRLHVGIVQDRMDAISKGLDQANISFQSVYDRSAFLAKYTDVVP